MKYLFSMMLLSLLASAHTSAAQASESCEGSLESENTPSEPVVSWTHCANEHGLNQPKSCDFAGLREMRFGNGVQWVYKKAFNGMSAWQCKQGNWPKADFEWAGGPYRCEFSSKVETEFVNEPANCSGRHDCAGFDLNMPAGHQGFDGPRVKSGGEKNVNSDIGAFRTQCEFSHFAYDDPLVYPMGEGDSHLHVFMGNTSVNAFSDTTRLAEVGNSTCKGGTLNRSAYWAPALLDNNTKMPMIPKNSIFYYKEGYNGLSGVGFDNLPKGLGLIGRNYHWRCSERMSEKFDSIPACSKGEILTLAVHFPQCWDGVNLWLEGELHTADTENRTCPVSHPVPLPEITINLRYVVDYEGQSESLMLSSDMHGVAPGSTGHADWVNGWDSATSEAFINNCLNSQDDCHANILGNGKILY